MDAMPIWGLGQALVAPRAKQVVAPRLPPLFRAHPTPNRNAAEDRAETARKPLPERRFPAKSIASFRP